jgi:pimeloyl-ACP methyl ester carboxylesterase
MATILSFRARSAEASGHLDTLVIRGRTQTLHTYGTRGHGDPVILASGDGGWIHLGPHAARTLEAAGFFVVGVDARAYLHSFTSAAVSPLQRADVAGDFRDIAEWAAAGSGKRAILVGVSEGAGLSVLAASDARARSTMSGVVALGLPDVNELAWRWKDAVIYVTHGVPREPTFRVADVIAKVAPLPVAVIQSTRDEYVPLEAARALVALAGEPRRLWIIPAANHRFSGNLAELDRRLLDAVGWVKEQQR